MSTKHLIATIVTVAFTIASTALTATTAFAETPDDAVATSAASTGANMAVSGAALAGTKAETSHGLTRAEVIAQTLEARKKGLIPETEADFDVAQTKKHTAK
jgi:hypothetical protein